MSGLVYALALAGLIGLPQLWASLRYYPSCVRSGQTAQAKQARGSLTCWQIVSRMIHLDRDRWVDGIAPSEAHAYPGAVLLVGALLAPLSPWHGVLLLGLLLSMGRHTPLFGWTAPLQLHLPVRWMALVNLSLILLGIQGWMTQALLPHQEAILCLLGATEIALRFPSLIPSYPYAQRWMRPSDAVSQPLARYLGAHLGAGRASGLPYPHRTGLLAGIRTLGYNGASRPKWMARLRPEEGGHDGLRDGRDWLDEVGAEYFYAWTQPARCWATSIPHLWMNLTCR